MTGRSPSVEWDHYEPADLNDVALEAQVERWVEEVQRLHRELAAAQMRRTAVVRERMLRHQSSLPLDAEGDCRACGHHPLLHGLSGCHEWVADALGDAERCDCEIERVTLPARTAPPHDRDTP